jgi:hypothetical protein
VNDLAVLDLQGMQPKGARGKGGPPPGSRTSKGCGNQTQSNVSLIICIVVL